ncbi:transposon resolvase [Jeotgalibacillus campisalis]|uniref:Transposon resolvase n=1 Tax=Jeotgalibacillus campisalis TaxID=220754 RepID=A0A0C2VGD8_9BACL|nr:transposon resolvase [Jeotgalibacillus campisalis]
MRQRKGIELAKKAGKFKGRLKKYLKNNHAGTSYAVNLYNVENMTLNQIFKITNVSKALLYRKLSERTVDELYPKSEIYNSK